ncbi:hypothetical protein PGT21_023867 [Puccinia graminis f. sp. tritici]|uniref:WHEP-TRS domain-containing protein n=1 Tax=Puccinia graminis f. sp. tritici TaxID=56615 RepID=A0A5B0QBB4_PUCGR|nr:hypothetical protein PGT21_023867 [Puccinia graminis f. sp. tritici]
MPSTSELILKQLNAPKRRLSRTFGIDLLPGHTIGDAIYLFRKIDPDRAAFWRKQYGGSKPSGDPAVVEPSGESKKAKKKAAHGGKSKGTTPAGPLFSGPKPPEMVEIELAIVAQGERVRQLKAGSMEGEVGMEVSKLLGLKKDLALLIEQLSTEGFPSAGRGTCTSSKRKAFLPMDEVRVPRPAEGNPSAGLYTARREGFLPAV